MSRVHGLLGIAGAVAMMLLLRAGAQQADQRPQLPAALALEVAQDKKVISKASRNLDDVEQISRAVPLAERVLEIRRANQGENWWETADAKRDLATLRRLQSLTAEQRSALAQAGRTSAQASELASAGMYDDAIEALLSLSNTVLQIFGEDDPWYASTLANLAGVYTQHGKYGQAEPLYQHALAIDEKALGPDHPDVSTCLDDLASLYEDEGHYTQAEPLYKRSLAIMEEARGPDDPNLANELNNLAVLYDDEGQYDLAEQLYKRSLAIVEKILGPDTPALAIDLNNLAGLYEHQGKYAQAESLFLRALAIQGSALGQNHPDVATSLNNLAKLYFDEGQYTRAEPLYKRALAINENVLGPDHPRVASGAGNLAELYEHMDQYAQAEPLLQRALAIDEKTLGPDHPKVADCLNNLASLFEKQGQYAKAEPLVKRALAIREKVFGPNHPDVAESLNNLAELYFDEDQYARAEPLFQRALAIEEKALGTGHPLLVTTMNNLASLFVATKRKSEAADLLLRSSHVDWQMLTTNFPTMTDQQKRQFLSNSTFVQSDLLLTLILQRKGVEESTGFEGTLLSKGLLFEAARQESGAMRNALAAASPESRSQWQELSRLRGEYASLALETMSSTGTPERSRQRDVDPAELDSLSARIGALEQELRHGSAAYAEEARLESVTLADVSRALRPGEALVEYTRFTPYDFADKKWGDARYGAYVLRGGSGTVAAIDLGDAAPIDAAVKKFQAQIYGFIEDSAGVTPSRSQIRRSEQDVDEASAATRTRVWQPLESHLTGIKRVYVAPDGQLNLIPFEALARKDATGDWRYLVEDRELIYMDTGRDLGRLALSVHSVANEPKTAVLIGNPAFDAKPEQVAAVVAGLQSASRPELTSAKAPAGSASTLGSIAGGGTLRLDVPRPFPQVPVLEQLIDDASKQLKRLGWSVTDLTGDNAVEEAAESVRAPRILQFATHGFVMDRPPDPQSWDNPLLRSMLILAGADDANLGSTVYYRVGTALLTEAQAKQRGLNQAQLQAARIAPGDGLLTAYEVTGMDLQGTELVNLTACETALGEVTPDGVAGLRQAFLMAGARSITVSMWEVPADETTAQVSDFYDRWLGGTKHVARYQAFYAAQLAALARARQDHGSGHPFYWAGIVYVGDPGDLPAAPKISSAGK